MKHISLYVRKISKDLTLRYLIISSNLRVEYDSRFDQAIMALEELNNEEKELICEATLESLRIGSPLPSLIDDFASDANWWAENSSKLESEHYWKAISDRFDIKQSERALRYMDLHYQKSLVT